MTQIRKYMSLKTNKVNANKLTCQVYRIIFYSFVFYKVVYQIYVLENATKRHK